MKRTKVDYDLHSLFQDIANNAAADRAGKWLEIAAEDYPWLFTAITENLDSPPETVLGLIGAMYPAILGALLFIPRDKACDFIAKLQAFFKERNY